jgi:hydroxymethylpyrimidine kinase/phosphomethylpyrimidine kinase
MEVGRVRSQVTHSSLLGTALSIAGSDSGGGAGIQADLAAFAYFRLHGTTAITAVTAQNPHAVTGIEALSPELVRAQIAAVRSAFRLGAVKTGMLFDTPIIQAVADSLADLDGIALVVDPVMVATSGARLLREEAQTVLAERLLPLATLATPNLPETEILLGHPVSGGDAAAEAACELATRYGTAVVVKGGHATGDRVTDFLATPTQLYAFHAPRVAAATTHGTGCSLSSAVAACLACGDELPVAFHRAKAYVLARLRTVWQAGPKTAVMCPPGDLPLADIIWEVLVP